METWGVREGGEAGQGWERGDERVDVFGYLGGRSISQCVDRDEGPRAAPRTAGGTVCRERPG